MNKIILFFSFNFLCINTVHGQEYTPTYTTQYKTDLVLLGSGLGLTLLGNRIIDGAEKTTRADLEILNAQDVWSFDRGATSNASKPAQAISDVLLFTSFTLPFLSLTSKLHRKEGSVLLIMAAETILLTNGITNISKGLTERFRPFNYNPEFDEDVQLSAGSRLSFISGHTSQTAALTFLTARVLTDMSPQMKHKGVVWASAIIIPAIVAYTRYEAGKHFPTDVIAGYAVGASIGYLIPSLHLSDNIQMGLLGSTGFSIRVNIQ